MSDTEAFGIAVVALLFLGCYPRFQHADPALRVRPIQHPALPARFPRGFQFGFATVAYQSEGTRRADGSRVPSNWSEWEDLGKIEGGQRNDRGNGFFRDYEAELDRAAALGATSFSYAIDWARLEPAPGRFDDAELARVIAIVKAMRKRHLRPLIVLFHWVTPTWVQSPKSGLDLLSRRDRAFVDAFLPLVDHVVPALAPLVDDWVTFEEPWSIIGAGYLDGIHPPGGHLDVLRARRVLLNLMYLHARTYHRIHQLDAKASVGVEMFGIDPVPLRPGRVGDISAAERLDYVVNRSFLDAISSGDVDTRITGSTAPHVAELERTLDFIGINYYQRVRVRGGGLLSAVPIIRGTPYFDVREYDPDAPHSDIYQEIAPSGLRRLIDEYAAYGVPLVITENGLADASDETRPLYLLEHLYTVARAIAEGRDIRGYYAWTISDNFEWSLGAQARFGLFRVDFTKPGFPRTRTRSADLFEAVARHRRIDRALWDRFTLPAYPAGRR